MVAPCINSGYGTDSESSRIYGIRGRTNPVQGLTIRRKLEIRLAAQPQRALLAVPARGRLIEPEARLRARPSNRRVSARNTYAST